MGAIENIARAESFSPGSVYGRTAEYRSVKRELSDIADRLTGLIGNMGIEGNAARAIDESITNLVDQIRERSENVNQLADARSTATSGGDTAGERSKSIQPRVIEAETMMQSEDPKTAMQGEQLYMRLDIEAQGALSSLAARTSQAIGQLPVVFPETAPVSQGGGSQASLQRTSSVAPGASSGPAIRPSQSATNWMPQAAELSNNPASAGSRASLTNSPVTPVASTNPGFQPADATANTGAVGEHVSQPIENGFEVTNTPAPVATPGKAFTATTAPFDASQHDGFGVAKAAAGAAALPAMAKAVSRAQGAMKANTRGGATARSAGAPARGATPRGAGAPARASGRSGATTRAASPTSRGGLAPRSGQGAATRAGTPARGASPRAGAGAPARGGSGASSRSAAARGAAPARGTASARGGAPAARGSAARGATGAGRPAQAKGTAGARGAGAAKGAGSRSGVTAPRQQATGRGAAHGRGMMGRPVSARGNSKKDKSAQAGFETFAATELTDDTTVTFIEAGHREPDFN